MVLTYLLAVFVIFVGRYLAGAEKVRVHLKLLYVVDAGEQFPELFDQHLVAGREVRRVIELWLDGVTLATARGEGQVVGGVNRERVQARRWVGVGGGKSGRRPVFLRFFMRWKSQQITYNVEMIFLFTFDFVGARTRPLSVTQQPVESVGQFVLTLSLLLLARLGFALDGNRRLHTFRHTFRVFRLAIETVQIHPRSAGHRYRDARRLPGAAVPAPRKKREITDATCKT